MANRYARTVGGNWTDNATWSTTSGGAADTVAPTASDDVFLDANSGNVTISATSVGKSLTCTGYTGTLTHNGFSLTISGSITFVAGMTYTALSSSSLNMNAVGTFTSAGKLAPSMNMGGAGALTLGDDLTFLAAKTVVLSSSNTITLNGKTLSGNSSTNRVLIRSNTLGTAITITNTTGTFANADFRDITFSTNADYSAITGLAGDCGGNSGSTLTTGVTQTYTGGTGSWSDVTKWTSRVPLPQDDVVMSGVTGGTITADMPRLGKSIDWTGASGTPTWSFSTAGTFYGSFTLISGMTFTQNSNIITSEGRSTFTLTSSGKTFSSNFDIRMVGGTLTLNDAFSSTNFLDVYNGTLSNSNNMSVSILKFDSSTTGTRTLNMGSAVWNLSGVNTASVVFNISTSTGMTITSTGSTILFSDTSATAKTFAGGGLTYNDLKISGGGAGAVIITGANTFNRIYTDGGGTKSITLPGSTTTTLLSGAGLGNGTNVITFTASAGSATVAKSGGGTVGWDYVHLTNIIASTANTWYAGTHSTDNGGNTNWIFTAVPSDYYSGSINDFKQAWYSSRGYTRTLNDNELAYFNTENSTTFISIRDAKSRFFLNLGYSGTLGDMYYKSLLTTLGLSASSFSVTDAERIFYSNTSNEFV